MYSNKEQKAKEDLYHRYYELEAKPMECYRFYENGGDWSTELPRCNIKQNPFLAPLFVVYKPGNNNWVNANKLCNYAMSYDRKHKAIGDWPSYIFFSPKCTQGLMDMINIFEKKQSNYSNKKNKKTTHYYDRDSKAKVYQFESSSFRYNILAGNIMKIEINNRVGDTIEYLVFPFASHRDHKTALFGLAQVNEVNHNNSSNNNSGNFNNNNNNTKQKWRCDCIYTMQGLIDFFQAFSDADINKDGKFVELLPKALKYRESEDIPRSTDNIVLSDEFRDNLRYNLNNSNSGKNAGFDKYGRLKDIMYDMGLRPNEFMNVLFDAFDRSINFAKQYNDTILTQVYIDGKFARLYYEPVLYCEIWNWIDSSYHKVGLPMIYKKSEKRFEIKGILTEKMAMDNIGINKSKSRFRSDYNVRWWNSTMDDPYQSFYQFYMNANNSSIGSMISPLSSMSPQPSYEDITSNSNSMSNSNTTISSHNSNNSRSKPLPPTSQSVTVINSTKSAPRKNRGKSKSHHKIGKRSRKAAAPSVSTVPSAAVSTVSSVSTIEDMTLPTPSLTNTLDDMIKNLQRNIQNILDNPHISEFDLLLRFIAFGETLFKFCTQNTAHLLNITNEKQTQSIIINVKHASFDNNNQLYSADSRWEAFWNGLIAFSNCLQLGIINKFGKNSLLFDYIGEKALLSKRESNPHLVHTFWFDKMKSDYLVAAKNVIVSEKPNGPLKPKGAASSSSTDDISDDIAAKPAKAVKPMKPPMLSFGNINKALQALPVSMPQQSLVSDDHTPNLIC